MTQEVDAVTREENAETLVTLVAILTVKSEALEKFRSFEKKAAAVMARYGGAIERTVVVPPDSAEGLLKEIHVVTFPNQQAFTEYRNDAELKTISHLRDESVVATELFVGEDGPDYR
jgi:uncharacterized protein (DUF1330 family)